MEKINHTAVIKSFKLFLRSKTALMVIYDGWTEDRKGSAQKIELTLETGKYQQMDKNTILWAINI